MSPADKTHAPFSGGAQRSVIRVRLESRQIALFLARLPSIQGRFGGAVITVIDNRSRHVFKTTAIDHSATSRTFASLPETRFGWQADR